MWEKSNENTTKRSRNRCLFRISRLAAVASDYARSPEKTVIFAPDRAERDELTQLIRADLYAQGKLGRDAHAVSVLVEKDAGNKMRVEGYEAGDKILYKTGSPNRISPDSQATVIETQTRTNQLSVRLDATRDLVSYNPRERPAQTRESRIFQEESREIAEGERIRFTRYDRDLGVKAGDLGTLIRLGQDNSMTVKLDSGKTTELTSEKTKHLDYGYTVDALKNVRAERVIATGDGITQQAFQGASPKSRPQPLHRNTSPRAGVQRRQGIDFA